LLPKCGKPVDDPRAQHLVVGEIIKAKAVEIADRQGLSSKTRIFTAARESTRLARPRNVGMMKL